MKKVVILAIIVPHLQANMAGDIEKQKQELIAKRKDIDAAQEQLKELHNAVQKELITPIQNTISNTIDTQVTSIQKTKVDIKKVPQEVLNIVNIGDLSANLDLITQILNETKGVLSQVSDRFQGIVQELDPQQDPKKVYYHLAQSGKNIDNAINELTTLEELSRDLGL